MNDKKVETSSGIGFLGILAIVFIVLKIIGKITWPWIWVLAPIWIPFIITVALLIFITWLEKR